METNARPEAKTWPKSNKWWAQILYNWTKCWLYHMGVFVILRVSFVIFNSSSIVVVKHDENRDKES